MRIIGKIRPANTNDGYFIVGVCLLGYNLVLKIIQPCHNDHNSYLTITDLYKPLSRAKISSVPIGSFSLGSHAFRALCLVDAPHPSCHSIHLSENKSNHFPIPSHPIHIRKIIKPLSNPIPGHLPENHQCIYPSHPMLSIHPIHASLDLLVSDLGFYAGCSRVALLLAAGCAWRLPNHQMLNI